MKYLLIILLIIIGLVMQAFKLVLLLLFVATLPLTVGAFLAYEMASRRFAKLMKNRVNVE
jgi:hypothetical protein